MSATLFVVRENGSKAKGTTFTERHDAVGYALLQATFGRGQKVIRIDVGDEGRSETVVQDIKPNFTESEAPVCHCGRTAGFEQDDGTPKCSKHLNINSYRSY
jgi:hypothetical protein